MGLATFGVESLLSEQKSRPLPLRGSALYSLSKICFPTSGSEWLASSMGYNPLTLSKSGVIFLSLLNASVL